MLEFKGTFSYTFMTDFGAKFEEKYQGTLPHKVYRSCYFILNELLQNVSLYSLEREQSDNKEYGVGSISVDVSNDSVSFITQNKISESYLNSVESKMKYYNSLTLDELKTLSKEKRKMEQETDSKGGGIGFIEIRRKAKSKINYEILEKENYKKIKIFINVHRGE